MSFIVSIITKPNEFLRTATLSYIYSSCFNYRDCLAVSIFRALLGR